MSLGLVAYDDSEESDTEIDDGTDSKSNITVVTDDTNVVLSCRDTKPIGDDSSEDVNKEESTVVSDEETELIEDTEHFPKIHLPESKIQLINTDIDVKCLTSANKKGGPVKITIPSLSEIENDDEQPAKKKIKPSKKGSGLFALLPDPKSTLVPQSVVNKKHNIANNKRNTVSKPVTKPQIKPSTIIHQQKTIINYEDSGDEEESSGTDFFSLDSKVSEIPEPVEIDVSLSTSEEPVAPKVNDDALQFSDNFQPSTWQVPSKPQSSYSPTYQPPSEYPTEQFMSFNSTDLTLDQEAMQQLCGRRDRLKMQQVSLIDVSGDAIMPDTREWLTKRISEEEAHRPSHKKRDGPTSQQKRKHQITYLAFQAKENELELKNQWSNNRMSRKQTQAKYGF